MQIQATNTSPFELLLIEDSPSDVRLTQMAFAEGKQEFILHVANDGAEALRKLRGIGGKPLRPAFILLDWNLPRMDGREVLREIKQDPDLCDIPVLVLTTSSAQADVTRAYELHANCFITKPINVMQFFEVIAAVKAFWLQTVTLPCH